MDGSHHSLTWRIEQLERSNRRLCWLAFGLPALAVLLGAAAVQDDAWRGKSVTTEKLVLIDGDGKERAALFVHKGEPVLELYNKDHSLILNAGKSPDNGVGYIQFFDSQGKFKGGNGGNALK